MASLDHNNWRGKFVLRIQIFLLLFLPIILTFSHRTMIILFTFLGALSLLAPGTWKSLASLSPLNRNERTPAFGLLCLGIFLCLYAVLSLLWVEQKNEWASVVQFSFFVFFAAALSVHWNSLGKNALAVRIIYALTVIFGAWLLGVEAMTMGVLRDIFPPEGNPIKDNVSTARGVGIAIILAVPLAQAILTSSAVASRLKLPGRLLVLLSVGGGLLLGALRFDITANLLALLAAIFCALGAYLLRALFWRLLIIGTLVLMIAMPFIGLFLPSLEEVQSMSGMPDSWLHRLAIWRFTVDTIFSSPLQFIFGGGVQFAAFLHEFGPKAYLPGSSVLMPVMISHPHNLFLQLWLEFGLVGVGAISFGMIKLYQFNVSRKISVPTHISWCALWGAVLVFCLVEANLWSYWRWAGPVLALILLHLLEKSELSKRG